MTAVNQKEYLKKYLGIGKSHGDKKKKNEKALGKRLKIIDDDIDVSEEIKEDLAAANEDAPQIVAVIDDRPPSLRVDEKTKNKLWKPIGETDLSLTRQGSEFSSSLKLQKTIGGNRKQDMSPKRRRGSEDMSPKRKSYNDMEDKSPRRMRYNARDHSLRPRNNDVDHSPKRRENGLEDASLKHRKFEDGDYSPIRRKHKDSCSNSKSSSKSRGYCSPGNSRDDESISERRNRKHSQKKNSRWADNSPSTSSPAIENAEKTFMGKKSGLQNAKQLMQELVSLKERENEIFNKMSEDMSGKNAETVLRKKKTVIPEEDAEKKLKQKELEDKYSRWGKGIKQVDDQNEKIAEQLHEMSKPLARYADDEDLEKYLKEQEREGDPMLMYIRKKNRTKAVEAGTPDKPVYMGDFMPNRFGIRPGYRWDGVDRSNGYEAKLFQVKNSEKAAIQEALMWNTEDMGVEKL